MIYEISLLSTVVLCDYRVPPFCNRYQYYQLFTYHVRSHSIDGSIDVSVAEYDRTRICRVHRYASAHFHPGTLQVPSGEDASEQERLQFRDDYDC